MKPKTQFTLNIIGYTLGLIGGFSLAIVMAVTMLVDKEWDTERLMLLIIGLILTVFAFIRLLGVNKQEEDRRVTEAVEDLHEYMAEWTVNPQQWQAFVNFKLSWERKEARYSGLAIGFLLGVVIGLVAFVNLPITEAGLVAAMAIALGYVAGLMGARKSAQNRYDRDRQIEQAEIHFAKQLIVMNGQLIQIKDFGIRPLEVKLEERSGIHLLMIRIETGLGNRKSNKQHWIPVPKDQMEKARKICALYAFLVRP